MMNLSLFHSLIVVMIVVGVSCGDPPAGADPICGDGVVNPGVEACDDGNLIEEDACLTTCQNARCGDAFVHTGIEECDDGNRVDTDLCRNTCQVARCGDGVVGPGEGCDDGNEDPSDDCNACQPATCGDGIVQEGEFCDDGNAVETDACLSTCAAASCGDGFVHDGIEACDDGNAIDTDECLSTCIAASCGDGFIHDGIEACDDGNASDTDDCLSTCITATCGDGFIHGDTEECDDANAIDTDGCLSTCTTATCGDGFIHEGIEECDDSNAIDTDECLSTCIAALCGDGQVQAGVEDCDDGNQVDDDECSNTCRVNPVDETLGWCRARCSGLCEASRIQTFGNAQLDACTTACTARVANYDAEHMVALRFCSENADCGQAAHCAANGFSNVMRNRICQAAVDRWGFGQRQRALDRCTTAWSDGQAGRAIAETVCRYQIDCCDNFGGDRHQCWAGATSSCQHTTEGLTRNQSNLELNIATYWCTRVNQHCQGLPDGVSIAYCAAETRSRMLRRMPCYHYLMDPMNPYYYPDYLGLRCRDSLTRRVPACDETDYSINLSIAVSCGQ